MEAVFAFLAGPSRAEDNDPQVVPSTSVPINTDPPVGPSSVSSTASVQPDATSSQPQPSQSAPPSIGGLREPAVLPTTSTSSRDIPRREHIRATDGYLGTEAPHARLASIAAGDLQGLLEVCMPFLALFLVLFVVQQFWGLIQYGIVFVSVSGSTLHLQRLVSANQDTKLYKVLDVLSIVLLNVWALSVMGLPDEEMLRNISLRPPLDRFDVWQCLYYAMVSPLIVKQWMIVPKVLTVLLFVGESGSASGMRRQAAVLTFLEYLCVAWTEAMPTVIWFGFFLNSTSDMIVCAILTGWYMALKTHGYIRHVANVITAAVLVFSGRTQHGVAPVQEEVLETGNQCPICQDALKSPLKLDCGHIYCDECIGEWLERERTCPMCRKVVRHAGLPSFGNGATSFMPNPF